jgi:DNA-binding response OmpR family regulator
MQTTLRQELVRRYVQDQAGLEHPALEAALSSELLENGPALKAEFEQRLADRRPLVLAADPSPELREIYAAVLEKEPFQLSVTGDGRGLLAKVRLLQPSVVIASLQALASCPPCVDWVVSNLKSPRPIPVLFITLKSREELGRVVPPDLPAQLYLQKPVAFDRIARSLLRLFCLRRERGN